MNLIATVLLGAAGISCFVWIIPLSGFIGNIYSKEFHRTFGSYATIRGWDNAKRPLNRLIYICMVGVVGVVFLLGAVHAYFGTIYY